MVSYCKYPTKQYAKKILKHTVSYIQYKNVNMDIHLNNGQNRRPIILVKQIAVWI